MGGPYIFTDYSTRICTTTGEEIGIPIDTRHKSYTLNQPLWVGYNRVNRFRKVLQILFYPGRFGSISGAVFLMMKKKGIFDSVETMCLTLKNLKSRAKNYNAIHLYAMYFVKNYVPPTPPLKNLQNNILADFAVLEKGMEVHYPHRRFFSYRWVLIKLLQKYKLITYIQFVKPLLNKTSSKKYNDMFTAIMNASIPAVIRDIPQETEQQLGQPRDDGSRYLELLCEKLHLSVSGLR